MQHLLVVVKSFLKNISKKRAGINEDGEPCVGWWLEYKEHKRSCPVWAFHIEKPNIEFYILRAGGYLHPAKRD